MLYRVQSTALGQSGFSLQLLPGASVTIRDKSGNIASVFSDPDGVTSIPNPIAADGAGGYDFYVAFDDYYDIFTAFNGKTVDERVYPTSVSRANHIGTQSADTVVDGTANKVLTTAKKTDLDQVSYTTALPDGQEVIAGDGTYKGMQFSPSGGLSAVISSETFQAGRHKGSLPGIIPNGALSRLTKSGMFWQVIIDGDTCVMRQNADSANLDPMMLDTMLFALALRDGQSWNTQIRYAADLDNEDPTGFTRRSVQNFRSADVCEVRADADFSPRIPYDNRIAHMRAYSTDGASGASGDVVGLRMLTFDGTTDRGFFRTGHITSLQRQHCLRANRATRHGLINLTCGMAGQSEDKFLAPGSTYIGAGGATISAGIVASNTRTFYENDTIAINQIKSHVRDSWRGRRIVVDSQTFDQGGAGTVQSNDNSYLNFLNVRRSDLDARGLATTDGGKVHMVVPQGFAASKEVFAGYQPMDQLRWAQANASGRDWLAGPFYAYKLLQESVGQSAIHGTAMHNVIKGETMGLCEAYVLDARRGSWQPLWITNVSIVGSTITITTNAPPAASGGMVLDTTTIEAATAYGFTLRNNAGGGVLTLGTPVITNATTITIPVVSSLVGVVSVEFGYAVRGVAQADATVGQGTHSGCWGNIKAPGKHTGMFTGKAIDLWLCEYLASITL